MYFIKLLPEIIMKVLLFGINARYTHSNPALYSLRNYAEKSGHDCILIEKSINMNFRELLKLIFKQSPDVLVLSVYIWNVEVVKNILIDIKNILEDLKIVIGGPEVSYNQDFQTFALKHSDYIVKSGGEKAFSVLAENNFEYDNQIINLKNYHLNDLDFYYKEDDFVNFKNRFLYYESSRGCPFNCSYCLSSASDIELEFRNLATVFKELEIIENNFSGTVKFIDRTFNSLKQRARDIWSFIYDLDIKNTYHFEIHPEFIDEDDIEILAKFKPDRLRFEIGIQSANESTLVEINRSVNVAKIRENISLLKEKTNIHLHLDLIAGLPGENIEDISNSFNYVFNLNPEYIQLGFLKVLPGTHIYDSQNEYGMKFSKKSPYMVYSNSSISFEEIMCLEEIDSFMDAVYNSNNFKYLIKLLKTFFKDYFDLVKSIVEFSLENDMSFKNSNWNASAKHIFNYFLKKNNTYLNQVIDSLQLDYLVNFNTNIPDFLLTDKNKKNDFRLKKYIKENYDNCIEINRVIPKKQIVKSYAYKNISEFNPLGIKEKEYLIFYKSGNVMSQYNLAL